MAEALWERLRPLLQQTQPSLLALSGGSDSAVLLTALVKAGQEVTAATFTSPLHPRAELGRAEALAERLGVPHLVLEEDPLADEAFRANPPERCYLCKKRRLSDLAALAAARGLKILMDGANADDHRSHRPGLRAAQEAGVKSPLAEAGLTKNDVWTLGRHLKVEDWLRPASACLATRVVYNQPLSGALLARIEEAESLVAAALETPLGLLRARVHGPVARLEVPPQAWSRLSDQALRTSLAVGLKKLGFVFVTADLAGFASGSMDALLQEPPDDES